MSVKHTEPENNSLESFSIIPEEYKDKVFMYSHSTFMDDEFIPPSKYFYTNSFGDKVFIRTTKRSVAQSVLNCVEGDGRFSLRSVVKAIV